MEHQSPPFKPPLVWSAQLNLNAWYHRRIKPSASITPCSTTDYKPRFETRPGCNVTPTGHCLLHLWPLRLLLTLRAKRFPITTKMTTSFENSDDKYTSLSYQLVHRSKSVSYMGRICDHCRSTTPADSTISAEPLDYGREPAFTMGCKTSRRGKTNRKLRRNYITRNQLFPRIPPFPHA